MGREFSLEMTRNIGIMAHIVAEPSCVSPILWLTPVKNKIRSVVVVLPASM